MVERVFIRGAWTKFVSEFVREGCKECPSEAANLLDQVPCLVQPLSHGKHLTLSIALLPADIFSTIALYIHLHS